MSRHCRNRGLYGKYGTENLGEALKAIKEKGISIGKASKRFSVPRTTLRNHLTGPSKLGVKPGRRRSIPEDIENEFVDKFIEASKAGFPMTKEQFLTNLGMLVKRLNLKTQFRNGIPGKDYWREVKIRRPDIALVRPVNGIRTYGKEKGDKDAARKMDDLRSTLEELELMDKPSRIWNACEAFMQINADPSKNSKESITALIGVNAAGCALPPLLVVKGKTIRSVQAYAVQDSPDGTVWTHEENAWVSHTISIEWFRDVFLSQCGPERPQVLIMDSQSSHIAIELFNTACEEKIHILPLPSDPAHTRHPVDRCIFGPFKNTFSRVSKEFLTLNPNLVINKVTWPRIFQQVWMEVMRPDIITKAFKDTEIYPMKQVLKPYEAYTKSRMLDLSQPMETVEEIRPTTSLTIEPPGSHSTGSTDSHGAVATEVSFPSQILAQLCHSIIQEDAEPSSQDALLS